MAKSRLTDNERYWRSIKEKDFQADIIKAGKLLGWCMYHPYYSERSKEGYPDLTCVHKHYGFFVTELKTETGKLSSFQEEWRDYFLAAKVEYHLWRPSNWNEIEQRLKGLWLPDQHGSGSIFLAPQDTSSIPIDCK